MTSRTWPSVLPSRLSIRSASRAQLLTCDAVIFALGLFFKIKSHRRSDRRQPASEGWGFGGASASKAGASNKEVALPSLSCSLLLVM
jgi:hypothetical protein